MIFPTIILLTIVNQIFAASCVFNSTLIATSGSLRSVLWTFDYSQNFSSPLTVANFTIEKAVTVNSTILSVIPLSSSSYKVTLSVTGSGALNPKPLNCDGTVPSYTRSPLASPGRSALQNGELFLGGQFIEIGISKIGSFGTQGSKPVGFYGTSGEDSVGMSNDADGFGTGQDLRIDFFMPGSPEERWSVGANGSPLGSYCQLTSYDSNLLEPKVVDLSDPSDGLMVGRTSGIVSKNSTKLAVTQTHMFLSGDKWWRTEVSLTNLGSSTLSNVTFMRSFDPDNTVFADGDYTTFNKIIGQYPTQNYSMVTASSLTDDYSTKAGDVATVFYWSNDPRSYVYFGGFANTDANDYPPNPTGSSITEDGAIGIVGRIGTLAPGQTSKTFAYYTALTLGFNTDAFVTEMRNSASLADSNPLAPEPPVPTISTTTTSTTTTTTTTTTTSTTSTSSSSSTIFYRTTSLGLSGSDSIPDAIPGRVFNPSALTISPRFITLGSTTQANISISTSLTFITLQITQACTFGSKCFKFLDEFFYISTTLSSTTGQISFSITPRACDTNCSITSLQASQTINTTVPVNITLKGYAIDSTKKVYSQEISLTSNLVIGTTKPTYTTEKFSKTVPSLDDSLAKDATLPAFSNTSSLSITPPSDLEDPVEISVDVPLKRGLKKLAIDDITISDPSSPSTPYDLIDSFTPTEKGKIFNATLEDISLSSNASASLSLTVPICEDKSICPINSLEATTEQDKLLNLDITLKGVTPAADGSPGLEKSSTKLTKRFKLRGKRLPYTPHGPTTFTSDPSYSSPDSYPAGTLPIIAPIKPSSPSTSSDTLATISLSANLLRSPLSVQLSEFSIKNLTLVSNGTLTPLAKSCGLNSTFAIIQGISGNITTLLSLLPTVCDKDCLLTSLEGELGATVPYKGILSTIAKDGSKPIDSQDESFDGTLTFKGKPKGYVSKELVKDGVEDVSVPTFSPVGSIPSNDAFSTPPTTIVSPKDNVSVDEPLSLSFDTTLLRSIEKLSLESLSFTNLETNTTWNIFKDGKLDSNLATKLNLTILTSIVNGHVINTFSVNPKVCDDSSICLIPSLLARDAVKLSMVATYTGYTFSKSLSGSPESSTLVVSTDITLKGKRTLLTSTPTGLTNPSTDYSSGIVTNDIITSSTVNTSKPIIGSILSTILNLEASRAIEGITIESVELILSNNKSYTLSNTTILASISENGSPIISISSLATYCLSTCPFTESDYYSTRLIGTTLMIKVKSWTKSKMGTTGLEYQELLIPYPLDFLGKGIIYSDYKTGVKDSTLAVKLLSSAIVSDNLAKLASSSPARYETILGRVVRLNITLSSTRIPRSILVSSLVISKGSSKWQVISNDVILGYKATISNIIPSNNSTFISIDFLPTSCGDVTKCFILSSETNQTNIFKADFTISYYVDSTTSSLSRDTIIGSTTFVISPIPVDPSLSPLPGTPPAEYGSQVFLPNPTIKETDIASAKSLSPSQTTGLVVATPLEPSSPKDSSPEPGKRAAFHIKFSSKQPIVAAQLISAILSRVEEPKSWDVVKNTTNIEPIYSKLSIDTSIEMAKDSLNATFNLAFIASTELLEGRNGANFTLEATVKWFMLYPSSQKRIQERIPKGKIVKSWEVKQIAKWNLQKFSNKPTTTTTRTTTTKRATTTTLKKPTGLIFQMPTKISKVDTCSFTSSNQKLTLAARIKGITYSKALTTCQNLGMKLAWVDGESPSPKGIKIVSSKDAIAIQSNCGDIATWSYPSIIHARICKKIKRQQDVVELNHLTPNKPGCSWHKVGNETNVYADVNQLKGDEKVMVLCVK